tara:strand:+ start:383 stop:1174 length:792 start_codon:yes stop_codon:yes gene_type:complete
MKKKLFFAHANGFPAETYGELFDFMPDFEVDFIPILAHGDNQIKNSWRDIAPEIIRYLELNYTEPIFAVGHSVGAIALAFAAERRPDLFQGIILMDPPVLSRKIRWILAIAQFLRISHKIMPLAKKAAARSETFPSREFVAKKLRKKFLFKDFSERSFDNYIQHGFIDSEEGIRLRFDKKIEMKIFSLTYPFYRGIKLNIPSNYLYATQGDIAEMRPIESVMHLFPNTKFTVFDGGGHLFPLEEPHRCAKKLRDIIQIQNDLL